MLPAGSQAGPGAVPSVLPYYRPATTDHVVIGDETIELKKGLLATLATEGLMGDARIGRIAAAMGAGQSSVHQLRLLVRTRMQVAWYAVRGEVPSRVQEHYERTLAASHETPAMTDPTSPAAPAADKKPRGARARVRELIALGETDDAKILATIQQEFPNVAFKIGDVKWQRKHGGSK